MSTGYLVAWSALWVLGSLVLVYHLWRRSRFSRITRCVGTVVILAALAFSAWRGLLLREWSTATPPPTDRRTVETHRVTRTLRLPGFMIISVDHTDENGASIGRQARTYMYLPLTVLIVAAIYGFLLTGRRRTRS